MHAFQHTTCVCAAKIVLLSQAGATHRHQILITSLCILQAAMSKGSGSCATSEPHILPYQSCAQLETPLYTALCTCGSAGEQNVTYA